MSTRAAVPDPGWSIHHNNKKRIKSVLKWFELNSSKFTTNSICDSKLKISTKTITTINNNSNMKERRRTNVAYDRRASYCCDSCGSDACYASDCGGGHRHNHLLRYNSFLHSSLMLLMCLIIVCASHLATQLPCVLASVTVSASASTATAAQASSSSHSMPPVSTISSQTAIVRRLYYSSAPSTSHSHNSNLQPSLSLSSSSSPYTYNRTKLLQSGNNNNNNNNNRRNSLAPSGGIRNGVAQITPISLDSTTYVHLSAASSATSAKNNQKNRANNERRAINSAPTISTTSAPTISTSTTTTSTPTSLSILTSPKSTSASSSSVVSAPVSRQGKSLKSVINDSSSTTTTTAAPSTNNNSTNQKNQNQSKESNFVDTPESNLCFLSHGGSSETFTVNEATPIGSVIGNIKVIGNASQTNGNIELSIILPPDSPPPPPPQPIAARSSSDVSPSSSSSSSVDEDSLVNSIIPIRIEPGTKRLVLARKLDKESVEGEASVTIGVRCRSRKSQKVLKQSQRGFDQNQKLTRKMLLDEPMSDRVDSAHENGVENDSLSSSNSNLYYSYDTSMDGSRNDIGFGQRDNDDDAIIIPIRILVTDANDNRPEWQGITPYMVNVSEMTSVGSPVLSGIRAIDNDQLGPYSTVEYYVEPGLYSHLFRFASPLEGTLLLASPLDYETLPKFSITIRAQDQGNPPNSATTKVEIRVIDADDQNPRFESDKYTGMLADGQRPGEPLSIQPRTIKAEDPDRGIRSPIIYGFNTNNNDQDERALGTENSYFKIDRNTGEVSLRRPLSGSVTLPLTLVIRATQLDNRDRYALTTLTIVNRRNQILPELRFLHSNYSTSLLESTPPGTVVLTVQISRLPESYPALSSPQRFQLLDDDEGYFSVRNSGEILVKKFLDYEKHRFYTFRVMVTDGRQSDVARVTVEALNVNEHDPIFGQPSYQFHVNEARLRASPIIGKIQATDADDGDRVQISLSGPHAGAFALAHDGTLRLRSLRLVNSSECHLIATAIDSGLPPRSSSASVMVKFSPQLLKSFSGRTLDSGSAFLFADFGTMDDDDDLNGNNNDLHGSSPSASDILQHSANIFTASTNSTALVLVIVLGVLLGTLFIIIVALTLHVLKNRKYKTSPIGSGHHRHNRHSHTDRHGLPVSSSSFPSSSESTASSSSSSSSSSNLSLNSQYKATASVAEANTPGGHIHPNYHHKSTNSVTSPAAPGTVSAKLRPVFFTTGFAARLQNQAKTNEEIDNEELEHLQHLHHLHHHHGQDLSSKVNNSNNLKSNVSQEGSHDSAISSDVSSTSEVVGGGHGHGHGHRGGGKISMIEDRVILDAEEEDDDDDNDDDVDIGRNNDDIDRISNESLPPPPPMSPPPNSSSPTGRNHHRPDSSSSSSSAADLIHSSSGNTEIHNSGSNNSGALGSRISVVKWPQGSIPRRVKKLTWQDEQRNNHLDQIYQSNSTVPVISHGSGNNGSSVTVTSNNNHHHHHHHLHHNHHGHTHINHTHSQSTAAKTKTLSGHLLTGTTSVPPPSSQLASYAMRGGGGGSGSGSSTVGSAPNPPTSSKPTITGATRPASTGQSPASLAAALPTKPTSIGQFVSSRDSKTASTKTPPNDLSPSSLHYHHYHHHHGNNLHTPLHNHLANPSTPTAATTTAMPNYPTHHHPQSQHHFGHSGSNAGGATLPDLTVYF